MVIFDALNLAELTTYSRLGGHALWGYLGSCELSHTVKRHGDIQRRTGISKDVR